VNDDEGSCCHCGVARFFDLTWLWVGLLVSVVLLRDIMCAEKKTKQPSLGVVAAAAALSIFGGVDYSLFRSGCATAYMSVRIRDRRLLDYDQHSSWTIFLSDDVRRFVEVRGVGGNRRVSHLYIWVTRRIANTAYIVLCT
jgi:hypothetical protein